MEISPRALKAGGAFVPETHRTVLQDRISEAQQRLDAALQAALSHVPIGRDGKQRREVVSKISAIHGRWNETKTAAIATGKLLLELKEQCREEYDTLFKHNLLPFGLPLECKLRKIAEAIRDERVEEANLPIAYTAAYEIVSLKSGDLEEAKARNLIRPETQRQQVLDFKRDRKREHEEANRGDPVKVLQARRAQLERRRAALIREMGEIDAELRQVNADLNPSSEPEAPAPARSPADFPREMAGVPARTEIIDIRTLRENAKAPGADFPREIPEDDATAALFEVDASTDFPREIGEGAEAPSGASGSADDPAAISHGKLPEAVD